MIQGPSHTQVPLYCMGRGQGTEERWVKPGQIFPGNVTSALSSSQAENHDGAEGLVRMSVPLTHGDITPPPCSHCLLAAVAVQTVLVWEAAVKGGRVL